MLRQVGKATAFRFFILAERYYNNLRDVSTGYSIHIIDRKGQRIDN